MKKNSAQQVKQFFNSNFFDADGNAVEAVIELSIFAGKQDFKFPVMRVGAQASLSDIFMAYHDHLVSQGIQEPEKEEADLPAPPEDAVTDFAIVQHRGNEYIIEQRESGFVVRKKDGGDVMKEEAPITRTILKKYKAKLEADKNLP